LLSRHIANDLRARLLPLCWEQTDPSQLLEVVLLREKKKVPLATAKRQVCPFFFLRKFFCEGASECKLLEKAESALVPLLLLFVVSRLGAAAAVQSWKNVAKQNESVFGTGGSRFLRFLAQFCSRIMFAGLPRIRVIEPIFAVSICNCYLCVNVRLLGRCVSKHLVTIILRL
jgi:hypothetical protein